VCIELCTIVAHNIAQNRPDSFPPYPPDNHHCSDDVYLREGGNTCIKMIAQLITGRTTYGVLVLMDTASAPHIIIKPLVSEGSSTSGHPSQY